MFFCSNDGSEFFGSVFQRINDKLETAFQVSWVSGTAGTRFAIGAKYCADKDTTFRVCITLSSILIEIDDYFGS